MAVFQEAHSQQFGRHLVSSKGLSAGKVILEQQPYAAVLYDDQVPLRCDWCFQTAQPGTTLSRCSQSKFAHYCSRDHQKAAWRAYFKQEAAALVACAPHVPPATVRLAARVLWRRQSELQTNRSQGQQQQQEASIGRLQQQLAGGTYNDVEALLSHWQQLDDARKLQYAQMAALTREFMQKGVQQPHLQQQGSNDVAPESSADVDVKQVALLLARFACNNHTICDEELRPIGVGIFPLAALVNHDCKPNCVQTFSGRNIVFRSLRPIPAGEQLAISYIELAATRQERRRQLMEQYFFDIDQDTPLPSPERQAAAPAPAMTSSNMQESGLHKLQLLVQFPSPPTSGGQNHSQQQQLLQLWTRTPQAPADADQQPPALLHSAGMTTDSSHSTAQSSKPPWPEDAPDRQLCQVLVKSPSVSSQQLVVKLPGGMCLLPQLPQPPSTSAAVTPGQAAGSTATITALSSLFQDLEGVAQAATSQGCDTPQQQQQQQQPEASPEVSQLECVQWGDWQQVLQRLAFNGAASSGPQLQQISARAVAVAGAGVLMQVGRLHQHAERKARQGDATAAMRLCRAALAAADGAAPAPKVQEASTAAIEPTSSMQDGGNAQFDSAMAAISADTSSSSSSGAAWQVVLGPQHILRIRVLGTLLVSAVDAAEWSLALQTARQLVPLYTMVYPQVWPNLGLHYALLAKLEMFLEQPAAAARAAETAAAVLCVTHGSSSAVLHEVCKLQYEAQQELAAAD